MIISTKNLSINLSSLVSSNLQKISKIYIIINKDKEPERYKYINDWLNKNNITNFQYFNYCYKDNLSESDLNKYYHQDDEMFLKKLSISYPPFLRNLSKSEISLAINHIKILEDAVFNQYNSILILESDAIFSENFIDDWNNKYSTEIPLNWDVVVLGGGNKSHNNLLKRMGINITNDKHIYFNPRFSVKCTEATLFSLNACKKILENIIPINAPIDHEYDYHLYENRLNVYLCEPPLVINGSEQNIYTSNINLDIKEINNKQKEKENENYPTKFYSQIEQDKYYVQNIIKYKKNGTFLDIGSYDGITFSNTYYLEKHLNWSGICIEPNPSMFQKCKENRKSIVCNKAIFEKSNEKIEFIIPCGNNIEGGIEQLCGLKEFIREKNLKKDFINQYSKYNTILVDTVNINELLDTHNLHNIDYMSLDTEGYELNILKSINYEKNIIKYITVEHGNDDDYQTQIKEFLESKNYIRHRNNKWDDEYMLIDKRRQVNSFDIFDTLITRKVKHPTDIFKLIENKYNIENFYQNRIRAEQLSNGQFIDIYNKYKEITGITCNNYINNLQNIEIRTELDNFIPIQSNIIKLKENDIVVSDMYLPVNVLYYYLLHFGVNKKIDLYVTPNGKSSGYIWNDLIKKYNILSHTGDNLHSDINMANNFGIKAYYTQIHKHTPLENILLDDLANILREFRLQNKYNEFSTEYILYDEQCRSNILLLCLFATQINKIMIRENRNKILFSTRDCCLLEKLYNFLFPEHLTLTYYTSRIMNKNYNDEYKNYIKQAYDHEKSIIIDLNGSFESGRKLYMEVFGLLPRVHLLCYNQKCELYDGLTYSCLHTLDDYIEVLNSGSHGTVINFYDNKPIFKHIENNIFYINIIHDTISKFIEFIKTKNLKNNFLTYLYATLQNQNIIDEIFSTKFFTRRYNNILTNKI